MRRRYKFYACPDGPCAKLRGQAGQCPVHNVDMVEVILRREDPVDQAKKTADKLKAAGDRVGEAAGKPGADPFNIAGIFDDMASDIRAGKRHYTDAELDEDEDEDDDD